LQAAPVAQSAALQQAVLAMHSPLQAFVPSRHSHACSTQSRSSPQSSFVQQAESGRQSPAHSSSPSAQP
jgi:hypothetical protein